MCVWGGGGDRLSISDMVSLTTLIRLSGLALNSEPLSHDALSQSDTDWAAARRLLDAKCQ